jgi:hypothetical protein
LALDVALRETPTRWWETHKEGIEDWQHCKRLMQIRFGTEEIMHKYTGMSSLTDHVVQMYDNLETSVEAGMDAQVHTYT